MTRFYAKGTKAQLIGLKNYLEKEGICLLYTSVSEPGVGSGSDRGKLVPKSGMEDGEKSCVYFLSLIHIEMCIRDRLYGPVHLLQDGFDISGLIFLCGCAILHYTDRSMYAYKPIDFYAIWYGLSWERCWRSGKEKFQ